MLEQLFFLFLLCSLCRLNLLSGSRLLGIRRQFGKIDRTVRTPLYWEGVLFDVLRITLSDAQSDKGGGGGG